MQKLLWHSNAPWAPTGYGQQTALFAPLLKDHYDLTLSSFYGLEGARLIWGGIPVLPGIGQDFGNACLGDHAQHTFGDRRGGLVFTLHDVWVLNIELAKTMNLICWTPIDHEPCMPLVAKFLLESGAVPVAMSKFGQEQIQHAGLDPLYCPHGVDTKVYFPHDKREVREEAQVPQDIFLVGMVAANKGNPSRKGFQQAFQAFREFRKKHDDAMLYLHTVPDSKYAAGEDLLSMAQSLGITDSLVTAPQYRMLFDPLPATAMGQLYSAFDVFLNPGMGEGFGVPILEAAACGVPSIVTNFSSMPEVAGPAGWPVGCRPYWTNGKSWQAIADVAEILDALEAAYEGKDREARSKAARDHALEYDVAKVFHDHMLPSIEAAASRFGDRTPEVIRTKLPTAA